MADRQGAMRKFAILGGTCLVLVALMGAAGCTQSMTGDTGMKMPAATTQSGTTAMAMDPASMDGSSTANPDAQTCSACAGQGMAPMVMGTVKTMDGMQSIDIGVKGGYYSPNQFEAKTGTPIKVVFTGTAAKCLGKPQFKALNKNADFTQTGAATIELGSLTPGTYEFACGMGMTGGKIVVQ